MTKSILVVEDEQDIQKLIVFNLRSAGYRVFRASTGREAMESLERDRPDLVVLDLMLPDTSGVEICRHMRRTKGFTGTPIVILTAKSSEVDRIVCFELGVDDYVTKPFSTRELVLRVQAVLRRASGSRTPDEQANERLRLGEIELDPARHRAWVSGAEVDLTYLEFQLLEVFMRRSGRVQSRARLINDVWGTDVEVTSRTVDTHVKRLRDKLGEQRDAIETVRGVGYRFHERSPRGSGGRIAQ